MATLIAVLAVSALITERIPWQEDAKDTVIWFCTIFIMLLLATGYWEMYAPKIKQWTQEKWRSRHASKKI